MLKNKFVFEWGKKLGNYAYRWRLDFFFFSFRIHKWICSDDIRAYHSHPINMLIYVWRGKYLDHFIDDKGNKFVKRYKTGDFRIIKRNYRHFVEILQNPTWTILLTWGEPKRWAFWLKDTLKKKNRDKYFIEHGQHVCE
jgi:hypothetical protein